MQAIDVFILFYVLFTTATIAIALRLGVRLRYGLRRLFPEDFLIIFAWFAYVALMVILTLAVVAGLADSSAEEFTADDTVTILKMFFLHGYALYPCLWLVKFSIIAFYARLCWNTNRTYRIVTYITYGILGASFAAVMLFKTFNCFPLPRVWNPSDQCTGGPTAEYTRTAYLMTTSLLDICTDIICLVLPFAILKSLRIDLRKKIALGILFAIALMSVVCSCIRLSSGLKEESKLTVAVWAVVEATTALCVASAPALRPLIFRTSYFSRSSSASSPSRSINRSRTRPQRKMSQRKRTGTNASDPAGFNFDIPGVQVKKVVQVTTHEAPPGTGSSGDTLLYEPMNPKVRPAVPVIDPRALGYQAEVVAGDLEIEHDEEFTNGYREMV